MTIQARLGLATMFCGLWFGLVGPSISDQIHASTLEGPPPFSVQTVRNQLAENSDTGSPFENEEIQQTLADLAALELAEEERVMAIYGLLTPEVKTKASRLVGALPPLEYAVDPRFFEPIVPSVLRQCIEKYGYAVSDLPTTKRMTRPQGMDRQDVLMQILSATHHGLFSKPEAAMVLQGSIELLELQTKRMTLESDLRSIIENELSE